MLYKLEQIPGRWFFSSNIDRKNILYFNQSHKISYDEHLKTFSYDDTFV